MDIYSPPDAPFLPSELTSLPHTITTIPPTTVSSKPIRANTDWNVSSLRNSTFHDVYHPLLEVESFLNQLLSAFPNTTHLSNLGQSAEGRNMVALTISSGKYPDKKAKDKKKKKTPIGRDGEKLGFVIIGAQHAREVRRSQPST